MCIARSLSNREAANPLRLGVISDVLLDELFLVLWDLVHDENRVRRAHRNAGATIDAALRIHVELGGRFEWFLVLLGVNAVGWASVNAKLIFCTGISDYVCHDYDLPVLNSGCRPHRTASTNTNVQIWRPTRR